MKKGTHNIFEICYQACSYLLVVLMLSIPLVQLFHHHENSAIEFAHQDGKTSFNKSTEKCQLCDYLTQQHGKEFLLPQPTDLNQPLPKAIKIRAYVIAGNYTFKLQGFTNKGPPAQVSYQLV